MIRKRKSGYLLILTALLFLFLFSRTDTYFYWTEKVLFNHAYLTVKEAETRWGRKTFDEKVFQKGKDRMGMAIDLIREKTLVGRSYDEVKELLGPGDGGYYVSDQILTYRLYPDEGAGKDTPEGYSLLIFEDQMKGVDGVYIWKDW